MKQAMFYADSDDAPDVLIYGSDDHPMMVELARGLSEGEERTALAFRVLSEADGRSYVIEKTWQRDCLMKVRAI
jgi:hypothetical protein